MRFALLALACSGCSFTFPSGTSSTSKSPPPSSTTTTLTPIDTCRTECAGCCNGSVCESGQSPGACGSGGLDCVSCPSTSRCEAIPGGGQGESWSQLNCNGGCNDTGGGRSGTTEPPA